MSVHETVAKTKCSSSFSNSSRVDSEYTEENSKMETAAITLMGLGIPNFTQNFFRDSLDCGIYPVSPTSENSSTSTSSWTYPGNCVKIDNMDVNKEVDYKVNYYNIKIGSDMGKQLEKPLQMDDIRHQTAGTSYEKNLPSAQG